MEQNTKGKVLELFVSIKNRDRENPLEIEIDKDGILEDKFYAKGVERSILITAQESYLLAKEKGIDIKYGSLGENILININPYSLSQGSQLAIGEVILEITQNCTICNSLSKVAKDLPQILKSDRGIFAKTIKSGKIRKGDNVNILNY